jgi:putative transposase
LLVESDAKESDENEAKQVQRRADHCDLEGAEAGMATAEVCRRHGISSATFYKWKSKFGGLEVSEARRLRSLEEENSRLKKLLAEAMLDNAVLKDLASKKW